MSHTAKVIALGFVLLAVCLISARLMGGPSASTLTARAALIFVALWFVGAAINMWLGISRAGYSVREEAPIFFVVFLIPTAVALLVWWRYSRG
jgi:hypothetical protein